MKPTRKPFTAKKIMRASFFALAALAGCGEVEAPHIFGNEVPPEALAAPRVVEQPAPVTNDTPWPRLGDVPSKPKDFSPPQDIEESRTELIRERAEGQGVRARVEQEEGDAPTSADAPLPAIPPAAAVP